MTKEFQYRQRPTTDAYREGIDRVFGERKLDEPIREARFRTRVGFKEEKKPTKNSPE